MRPDAAATWGSGASTRRWPWALGLALAASAGCSLAPRYQRPETPAERQFAGAEAGEGVAAELGWRDVFPDPRLQGLIGLSLTHNRDLRIAHLSSERLRALYRIQKAPLLPSVNAGAGATFQGLPKGAMGPTQQYSATVGVTAWELDFFGRIRSLADAALEQYLASVEAQRSAQLSLVSQVVTADLLLRAVTEQHELATRNAKLVEQAHAITSRSFELGLVPEVDFRTSESQVQLASVSVTLYEQKRLEAQSALAFVVGAALPPELPPLTPLEQVRVRAELPVGLPSELLQRRPDLLAAEHVLRGANASIGAARAAFFPSISLTGSAGFGSTELSQLFSADGFTWLFAPRLNVPIFQGGALRANLEAAKLGKAIEIERYQRAIQVAFREVTDALAAQRSLGLQVQAQEARVKANERRYALAEERYRVGVESYLSLLTAQRDLFSSQQALVEARFARLVNVANLYRALGGGWKERSEERSQQP